jgi:hypothetical protein
MQTAIFAILDADVTLSALVTGVFDDVPESYTDFPYVTLGEDVLTEFDTDGLLGFRVSVTIHCWSQYKGQRETKLVQDAIYRALHHVSMTVTGYVTILSRQVDQTSERDPDGMTRHGVQTFELLVREPLPVPFLSPLNPDLDAMYTMDNITGSTLVDESPNGNDGAITGATAVPGHIGDALDFDGISDEANFSDFYKGTQGAVSMFVKVSNLFGQTFVGRATSLSNSDLFILAIDSPGNMEVQDFSTGLVIKGDLDPLTTGAYFHLVYQSTGSATELYKDGVLLSNTVTGGVDTGRWFGDLPNTGHTLGIGVVPRQSPFRSQFTIDQVRMFNRALTQAEIDELFNAGVGA